MPHRFIEYEAHYSFLSGLEQVRDRIMALAEAGQAEQAVEWLELFLAGCYERAETVDDSSGTFGDFVGELFCDWIVARQAATKDPVETAALLFSWMDRNE